MSMAGEGTYPALQDTPRSGFYRLCKKKPAPPNRRTFTPFNGANNPFKISTLT